MRPALPRASRSTSARATSSTPDFLKISPNNKIPAITDPEGPDGKPISLFESGAILVYLAGKTGKFLPDGDRARYEVLQWLMFQMGGVGPMLGQAHHFRMYAPEKIAYAIDRYTNEAKRLYGVIDKQLASTAFIAGDDLLDRRHRHLPVAAQLGEPGHRARPTIPHLKKWFDGIAARPAVQRGVKVLADLRTADHRRQGARDPVRQDAVREALRRAQPRPAG